MKPIRDEAGYEAALARIGALMSAPEGSPEVDELEVLSILVEKYEEETYPIPEAAAHEVLKLVMEENDLAPRDMIPFLGSPSTVSKVLNGKRELTPAQIRTLSKHLHIPVAALFSEAPEPDEPTPGGGVDWSAFPLVEMSRRALFGVEHLRATARGLAERAAEVIPALIGTARLDFACPPRLRQGIKTGPASDPFAVMAWLIEVAKRGQERGSQVPYRALSRQDLRTLATMSKLGSADGIKGAIAFLEDRGVPVVIVRHYKKTKIDGGVVVLDGGRPVIGLSLRHDKVDSFWFTLLHEAAHIVLGHVSDYVADEFLDMESYGEDERAANALVEDVTIPSASFNAAIPNPAQATLSIMFGLAQQFDIALPIVVGRVQFKANDYRKFSKYVGRNVVRRLFPGYEPAA